MRVTPDEKQHVYESVLNGQVDPKNSNARNQRVQISHFLRDYLFFFSQSAKRRFIQLDMITRLSAIHIPYISILLIREKITFRDNEAESFKRESHI